jgi:hypothetical protein
MKLQRSLTALAVTGVLVLSGCGGDDDNGKFEVGESASTSASESPSESPSESEADSASDEGDEVDKDEFLDDMREGIEEFTSAHVTMDIAADQGDMSGEGDMELTDGKVAMAMDMSMPALGDGTVEMRLVDGFMYMKMPGQTGGKFIKLDLSDPSGPLGSLSGLTDAFDPSKSFDTFAEGLSKVVDLGEDDLDGEALDHYRLTVDTSKVEAFEGLPGSAAIPETLEYDMWVDEDFRMRGIDMDLPTGQTTVRYTDLGEPVDIEAPPASQVTTMPGM